MTGAKLSSLLIRLEVELLYAILNSIPPVQTIPGHVLVVGDIYLTSQDAELSGPSSHPSACALACLVAAHNVPVTLLSCVGDDALADHLRDHLQQSGVTCDLLGIHEWKTFTANLQVTEIPDREQRKALAERYADGRRRRWHPDEGILPIDGMSEYQAHLQNRAEKYLASASLAVFADFGLGCVAEPRALAAVAQRHGVSTLAVRGADAAAGYGDMSMVLHWPDDDVFDQVSKITEDSCF